MGDELTNRSSLVAVNIAAGIAVTLSLVLFVAAMSLVCGGKAADHHVNH